MRWWVGAVCEPRRPTRGGGRLGGVLPYQDTVLISHELGVEYLWIDSLCIIQDDRNDWEIESAKMADVYSHAYLTIAATGSSTSSGGCLFARWHETDHKQITTQHFRVS